MPNKQKNKLEVPKELTCELLTLPELAEISTVTPKLGWSIPVGQMQTAYQIIVSSDLNNMSDDKADLWNTGKIFSSNSLNIKYTGKRLESNSTYYWRVRFWNSNDDFSSWSIPQKFITGTLSLQHNTARYPLEISEIMPVRNVTNKNGNLFYDFGKAAFGTISIMVESPDAEGTMEIHLGEDISAPDTIDRAPKGNIRYRKMRQVLKKGRHEYKIEITPDERNTGNEQAILMPDDIGEVMPFRYCEIANLPQNATIVMIKQMAVHYHFDDNASAFNSSDEILNQVWDLCKYSIKATSFCGIYVDGDRERIPYEGDAYINQLSHYGVEREYSLARYTHEYLIHHPTWPTEWILSSVLMAWADYMYTGDESSLMAHYDDLKAKTLMSLARDDGLISTNTGLVTQEVIDSIYASFDVEQLSDLVDWPPREFVSDGGIGERDDHEMKDINTVVNAYYYRNLVLMANIADVLRNGDDKELFLQKSRQVYESFNKLFFDSTKNVYIDGENSTHASLHSNMFALAFGLVPPDKTKYVADYVQSRGMACSVYGAQYLLEALYIAGRATYALELMHATTDRSWYNMLKSGSTVTLEAWDWKYKNNLDWNHAWGAAPANIIPRYLAGVQPLKPGFEEILIKPQMGDLKFFNIKVPTIRGAVKIYFEIRGKQLDIELEIPGNCWSVIDLSAIFDEISTLKLNNKVVDSGKKLLRLKSGKYKIEALFSGG